MRSRSFHQAGGPRRALGIPTDGRRRKRKSAPDTSPHCALSRSYEQLLRVVRRPKAVRPAGEIEFSQIARGDMFGFLEACVFSECQNLGRRKEAEERCPAGACTFCRALKPGAQRGVRQFERQYESHGK